MLQYIPQSSPLKPKCCSCNQAFSLERIHFMDVRYWEITNPIQIRIAATYFVKNVYTKVL